VRTIHRQLLLGFLFVLTYYISVVAASILTANPLLIKTFSAVLPIGLYSIYCAKFSNAPLSYQRTVIPRFLLWSIPWITCFGIFVFAPVVFWPETWSFSFYCFVAAECLMLSVAEELIFRGALFRVFQGARFPVYVLISSLAFGLLHFSSGITDNIQAMFIGLGYGIARVAGCPLSVLIGCHALTDFPIHLFRFSDELSLESMAPMNEWIENLPNVQLIFLSVTSVMCCIYLLIPRHWSNQSCEERAFSRTST